MRRTTQILFILTFVVFLAACSGSLFSPTVASQVSGKGMVRVTVAGSGERTLFPQTPFSKYEYTFTRNDGTTIIMPELTGSSETVQLEPGDWTIAARGFVTVNGMDYETAQGSKTVTVEAGKNYAVAISMDNPLGSAKGTFRYSVQFPAETTEARLKITSIMGSAPPRSINLLAENSGALEYPAGYYLVTVLLGNGRLNAGRTEVAHIYPNMETPLNAVFTEQDFSAGIYLAGTVNVSAPAGYTAETVSVYSDAACLNLIEESEVTGSNGWSMVIPASHETVYFRVTVRKDAATLLSKPETRVLRITGDEQIVLSVKIFTITPTVHSSGHGTVSANITAAIEGTTVTLTVDADAGYRLKIDSLKVSYGTGSGVVITRDSADRSVYTFTMPSGNITINAEFVPISADLKSLSIRNSIGTEALTTFDAAVTDYTVFVVDKYARITITGSPLYAEDAMYNIVPDSDNRVTLNFGEDNAISIIIIATDAKTGTEVAKTYNLKFIVSDIPVMTIDTGGRVIDSKEVWVEGVAYKLIDGSGGMTGGGTDIKGRGNSTWTQPKKPYSLKLSNTTSLLGMPEHKRWNLLANYLDRSLLRTDVAFKIGEILETGLGWTSHAQHVHLYLNNEYRGSYQLVEAIKIDKNRIDISEIKKKDPSGGYILEIFPKNLEIYNFQTTRGVSFTCSDPDEDLDKIGDGTTISLFEKIQTDVQHIEDIIYSSNFADEEEGYRKYIDVDSFVDWFFVHEIARYTDSLYMFYDPAEHKFFIGPLWDFDAGFGNTSWSSTTEGFVVSAPWFSRLFEDTYFVSLVKTRWNTKKNEFVGLQQYIDERANYLAKTQNENFKKWDITYGGLHPVPNGYEGEIAHLKSWLTARLAWLDTAINGL